MPTTVLSNVRVFDGSGLSTSTTVVIEEAVIGAVGGTPPDGADTVDGAGAVLLPGLFDAHVHMNSPDDLTELVAHGVTTGLDMACFPAERMRSFRGKVPDIRSAGTPAIGPGGPHAKMPGMPREALLTDPGQAEDFVARRVAEGVDYVKIVIDGDLLDRATIEAVVAAGKAYGKLTVAHASSVDAFHRAVSSGADVVTHAPRDGVLDEETIERMISQRQVAIPTLAMMEAVSTAFNVPDGYRNARESVTAMHTAGVPILAGTDCFSGPGPLPDPVRHGSGLHHELRLLVEGGLTGVEALRAATSLPARHFTLPDRGAVRPGLRADLVLVDGDPLTDITVTSRILGVWANGVRQAHASV
ncbi:MULTISPECIES: amidohydrolase family protein [unclassified Streptomyces]|uniref:amidohydrolase family protein n=1 Tax=unclassified Streptomyces TaxID=2593676 RepID=UPI0035D97A6C